MNNELISIPKAILATLLYIIGIELIGSWFFIAKAIEFEDYYKYYLFIQGALQLIGILIFIYFIKHRTFNNLIKKRIANGMYSLSYWGFHLCLCDRDRNLRAMLDIIEVAALWYFWKATGFASEDIVSMHEHVCKRFGVVTSATGIHMVRRRLTRELHHRQGMLESLKYKSCTPIL